MSILIIYFLGVGAVVLLAFLENKYDISGLSEPVSLTDAIIFSFTSWLGFGVTILFLLDIIVDNQFSWLTDWGVEKYHQLENWYKYLNKKFKGGCHD